MRALLVGILVLSITGCDRRNDPEAAGAGVSSPPGERVESGPPEAAVDSVGGGLAAPAATINPRCTDAGAETVADCPPPPDDRVPAAPPQTPPSR